MHNKRTNVLGDFYMYENPTGFVCGREFADELLKVITACIATKEDKIKFIRKNFGECDQDIRDFVINTAWNSSRDLRSIYNDAFSYESCKIAIRHTGIELINVMTKIIKEAGRRRE